MAGDDVMARDPTARAEFERNTDIYSAQQEVIAQLRKRLGGRPVEQVEGSLRESLSARGLHVPPPAWIEMVASEISAGRVYVVANGVASADQFSNSAAEEARAEVGKGDGVA